VIDLSGLTVGYKIVIDILFI